MEMPEGWDQQYVQEEEHAEEKQQDGGAST